MQNCSAGSTESVKPTAWKVHALVYWPVQCRIVTRNNSMAGLTDRVKIESIGAYSVQHWFKWRNPRRTGSTDVLVTSVGAMVMPLSREPVRGAAEALQPLLKPMVQIKRCRCIYVGIVQRACQAAAKENSRPVKPMLWKNQCSPTRSCRTSKRRVNITRQPTTQFRP